MAHPYHPPQPLEYGQELHATAQAMVADGKGLLAADESTGSIKKRLESVKKENSDDNRREWRDLLFTADAPLDQYLGGVITFEETLLKHSAQLDTKWKGKTLTDVIKSRGIIPGIKTDKGTVTLGRTDPPETTTQGLDGLLERSKEYYAAGARFSKWRATYTVSADGSTPSELAIEDNAHVLARYASISQQAGLVPIVEPEVLCNGKFDIHRSAEAHIKAYSQLFRTLALHNVDFAGMILKASMTVPGDESPKASPEEVAAATLHVLAKTVPPLVPGIVFLSGGLSEADSISYLNAINQLANKNRAAAPWKLTFSFGRALQGTAMKVWAESGDWKKAQEVWVKRALWSHQAALGEYKGDAEKEK